MLDYQSIWDRDPLEVRQEINQDIEEIEAAVSPVEQIINKEIEVTTRKTPIRIYQPQKGSDFPVILFIHGGAWVAGSLDTHDNWARYLSFKVEALVVSVGYTNSPEGKFPLPLEQCYDAFQ